ncbi:MAG: hypothetical protein IKQ61_08795 [Spirochaetales bacterium]|nr:hypothetical protein [Spirochaetales bacterium]MBR6200344.1 hypothetical protein [Spirochaetales bacterium]
MKTKNRSVRNAEQTNSTSLIPPILSPSVPKPKATLAMRMTKRPIQSISEVDAK